MFVYVTMNNNYSFYSFIYFLIVLITFSLKCKIFLTYLEIKFVNKKQTCFAWGKSCWSLF